MSHPGAIVTGRSDLHAQPADKHRWWDAVDPTYPIHVQREAMPKMGADERGHSKLVGFPVQTEWSGSWREFMSEAARPKPNTMSSLHYTMHQTQEAYVFAVTTHWKLDKTRLDLDQVAINDYRTATYLYITGPPPKASGNYPYDGPRGEHDMNRGRITLPRGADVARMRAAASLQEFADTSSGSLLLTIPKAPKDDAPTGDGVSELASVGGAPSLAEQRALRSPARSLRRSRDGPSKTPSDRMYREAQERKRLQDEANAKKRTEGCTFAPQWLSQKTRSAERLPSRSSTCDSAVHQPVVLQLQQLRSNISRTCANAKMCRLTGRGRQLHL